MNTRQMIETKAPVVDRLLEVLDPDELAAPGEWTDAADALVGGREHLKKLGFLRSSLGMVAGHHVVYTHWMVMGNGVKVTAEEPLESSGRWYVAVVYPPPKDWQKQTQPMTGRWVTVDEMMGLTTKIKEDAAVFAAPFMADRQALQRYFDRQLEARQGAGDRAGQLEGVGGFHGGASEARPGASGRITVQTSKG